MSDKLIQSTYWQEKLTKEILYNPERSHDVNMKRLNWLHKNATVVCPFCGQERRWNVAFQGHIKGLFWCRYADCRQADTIFNCMILDPEGRHITADYNWPDGS